MQSTYTIEEFNRCGINIGDLILLREIRDIDFPNEA
jgi:hypothetical protein